MAMGAHGVEHDGSPVIVPVDLNTAGAEGKLVSMKDCGVVTFDVLLAAAGSGVENIVITLREAQDGAGTGEVDLDVVTEYWRKAETTLDNDEQWTKVTQTAGDITIAGATYATQQVYVRFEVRAPQLSAGFTHVTCDIADPGSVARLASVTAVRGALNVQRAPESLAAPQ